MKVFIGILITIIVLTGATLTMLAMWNIYPISWIIVLKSGATIAIVCTTIFLIWLISRIFFYKKVFNKKE